MAHKLSKESKDKVETDARVDHKDNAKNRTYPSDPLSDVVFAPIDLLTGDSNSGDIAKAKQEHYRDVRESLERRDKK